MIDEKFIILAVILNAIGSIGYAIDTLKGDTKPNRVTWFLWALIPLIAFAGMLDENAGLTSLILTFMVGFSPFLIFCVSFLNKKSVWKIERFDWICGALSLIGIAGWLLTGEGYLAIVFSIFADFLALLPTMFKALKQPNTESWMLYSNAALASFITLLTVETRTFASIAFPLYIMVVCIGMFLIVKFKIGPTLKLFSQKA